MQLCACRRGVASPSCVHHTTRRVTCTVVRVVMMPVMPVMVTVTTSLAAAGAAASDCVCMAVLARRLERAVDRRCWRAVGSTYGRTHAATSAIVQSCAAVGVPCDPIWRVCSAHGEACRGGAQPAQVCA